MFVSSQLDMVWMETLVEVRICGAKSGTRMFLGSTLLSLVCFPALFLRPRTLTPLLPAGRDEPKFAVPPKPDRYAEIRGVRRYIK